MTLLAGPGLAAEVAPIPEDIQRRFFTPRPASDSPNFLRNLALESRDLFAQPASRGVLELGLMAALASLPLEQDDPPTGPAGDSRNGMTRAGFISGRALTTFGAAGAMYGIGALTDQPILRSTGQQAFESLLLSGLVVDGLKRAVGRTRPDGSDTRSFPSGHTAATFALATVLERNYGWKAGIPAYAFAGWVASTRVSGNRHHVSDAIFGAAVGVAVGRTVSRFHHQRLKLVPLVGRDTRGMMLSVDF